MLFKSATVLALVVMVQQATATLGNIGLQPQLVSASVEVDVAIECPPLCKMYCEYGNVADEKTGCPLCECKKTADPKPDFPETKPYYDAPVMMTMTGVAQPTTTSIEVVSKECPPVCMMHCEYGNVADEKTGCPLCECKKTPDPKPDLPEPKPYYDAPVLVVSKECPPVCPIACEYGNVADEKTGCPLCECKKTADPKPDPKSDAPVMVTSWVTDPCATVRCASNTQCISEPLPCFAQPCPVRAKCVPTSTSTRPLEGACVAGPLVQGQGGVEVEGRTIPKSAIGRGCRLAHGRLSMANSAVLFTTVDGTGIELTVAHQKIRTPTGATTLRAIPQHSCKVRGCSTNTWKTTDDGSSSCLINFALGSAGVQCFCDDACTQFRDCCADYQATCLTESPFLSIAVGEPTPNGPKAGFAIGEPNPNMPSPPKQEAAMEPKEQPAKIAQTFAAAARRRR